MSLPQNIINKRGWAGASRESYKIMLMLHPSKPASLKDTHAHAGGDVEIPRLPLLMWCDKWLFIEIDIAWNIQMIGGYPHDLSSLGNLRQARSISFRFEKGYRENSQ